MTSYNILKAGGTSVGTPEAMEVISNETLKIHSQALKKCKDSVTVLVVSATGQQETCDIRDKNTNLLEDILKGKI